MDRLAERRLPLLGSVLIVAVIGTVLIFGSHAATPYATSETETGTLGVATQQTDSTASGGKYVQFGSVSAEEPPTGGGTPTWTGKADQFSAGCLTQGAHGVWDDTQLTQSGDTPITNACTSAACTRADVVDPSPAPGMSGHKAFKFTNAKDCSYRSELAAWGSGEVFSEGDDWWFGDILYIPSNPNSTVGWRGNNHTLMQLKNTGTGSPPFELDLRYWGAGNSSNGIGAVCGGTWRLVPGLELSTLYDKSIRIELHYHFSTSSSSGAWQIYLNGSSTAAATCNAATLYSAAGSNQSYLKQGQYGVGDGNIVYWHGMNRGTSRASVQR